MNEVVNKVKEYKAAVKELKPFDLGCCFPSLKEDSLYPFGTPDEIIAGLEKYGIEKAAFWDYNCLHISPLAGNEQAIEKIKGHDNCYLCAVLGPDIDAKPGMLEETLDYYQANKLVAARMFPTRHNFSMQDWCVGNILKELEKRNIPLIFWHTEVNWDTVASVAQRYPNLKIIVEAIEKKMIYHARSQMMLTRNFKNVFFASYNLAQYTYLDTVDTENNCKYVLATNYPMSDPNMSFGIITEAHLSNKVKEYICHGFADSLLK